MNVYLANFGPKNWAWNECLDRDALTVMDDMRLHPFWQRRDRNGYIETAMREVPTKKGHPPTQNVATRWYNEIDLLHETAGDLWIHRDQDDLWWTVSTPEQPHRPETRDDPQPSSGAARIAIYFKPCQPWSKHDRLGRPLRWSEIHPAARDFLSSAGKGTFQKLQKDHPAFAEALIEGSDLNRWYILPAWQTKARQVGWTPGRAYSPAEIAQLQEEQRMRQTAARMVRTAQQTVLQSGKEVIRVTKDKQFIFPSEAAAQEYALNLMKKQEGRCTLTGLKLLLDEEPGDDQLHYSLDRIDSSRHYEPGNLQVVCKFVNLWKGAMQNEEFKRLIALLRS
jgi:hypothetical protein